LFFFRLNSIY